MDNKEVVDKLVDYFLSTSDPKTIARGLANCMLDYVRYANFDNLDEQEKMNFMARVFINAKEFQTFAKKGPDGKGFKLKNISETEEKK